MLFSYPRTASRASTDSQGGGSISALSCFFRRSASQSGSEARCGGFRAGVWPERRCSAGSVERGTTVTLVISQRKEVSAGERPGVRGAAMVVWW